MILNTQIRSLLGIEKQKTSIIDNGFHYAISLKGLWPDFDNVQISFDEKELQTNHPIVYFLNTVHILIDSTRRQGLFIYGFDIQQCSWDQYVSISSLLRRMGAYSGINIGYKTDGNRKTTSVLFLLQSALGDSVSFFDVSDVFPINVRESQVAARFVYDKESGLKELCYDNWKNDQAKLAENSLYSDAFDVINLEDSVYLCTSQRETILANYQYAADYMFTDTMFANSFVPIIATVMLIKNVVSDNISSIRQDDEVVSLFQQFKLLLSLTISRFPVFNTVFEQCKKAQNVSSDIDAMNSYLVYKIEKDNKARYSRQAKSDHRREVGIIVLTVSQVFFALISYLGIKDLLGNPAGQPWVTISAVLLGILVVVFFFLILRKK